MRDSYRIYITLLYWDGYWPLEKNRFEKYQ